MIKWRKKQIRNNIIEKPQNESMRKHKIYIENNGNFSILSFWLCRPMKWYLCHLCVSRNSKISKTTFFRSYFMIINERNNIAEYSIICMFRKCFVNIVPFSEIIFVLLQAYLLIRNRERYITSLVAAGYLQMTNPENPTASNQKYKKVTTK